MSASPALRLLDMREEGEGIGIPTSLPTPAIYIVFWGLPRLLDFTWPPKQDMKRVLGDPVFGAKAKQKISTNQIHPSARHLSRRASLPQ